MKITSFILVFSIQMAFIYTGLKSLPLAQMGALALALTVLSMGGMKLLKVR